MNWLGIGNNKKNKIAITESGKKSLEVESKSIPMLRMRVLGIIEDSDGGIEYSAIADELSLPESTVAKVIEVLTKEGKVRKC
jgi:predicted transcriptional regulator